MSVTSENAIRPFTIPKIPEAGLEALRARIAATRWPDQETVTDDSQGVPLAMIKELARHWATDYDWRRCEAKLNALPHFMTEIDGLDIHFIHVRSRHEDALPLIVTHGWPGSVIEQLKIIDPLTNPTAHGASAADAFHLVIPSLPGYGYSGQPTATGWDVPRIARAWVELMKRLGYTQFAAQRLMSGETEIRPFQVDVPDEAIADLRQRIAAVRWLGQELVADRSQGVQLATVQELARYWATGYEWRRCEAKLNALPQFTTQISSTSSRPGGSAICRSCAVRSSRVSAIGLHGCRLSPSSWPVCRQALG